jgi:hypothetical protein
MLLVLLHHAQGLTLAFGFFAFDSSLALFLELLAGFSSSSEGPLERLGPVSSPQYSG